MKYFQGTLGTETATEEGFSNHQGCPKGEARCRPQMFTSGERRRATSQEGHQGDKMYFMYYSMYI